MEKILHSSEKDQRWEYSDEGLLDKKLVYNTGGDPCYVDYDYDAYGKKTETEYPDGGTIGYHRDGYGRLRIVEDNRNDSDNIGGISTFAGKLEYDYDSTGRLSKTTNHYGYTVEYTYRSDGQKYSIIVKNPTAQEIYSRYFFYYPDGRLHFICQDNPFTGDIIAVFTYDANGNRKQMQYALEGNEQGNMATIDYEYDRRNHLIDLNATTDISSVETVIFHQDNLTVDGLGRLTNADELLDATTRNLSYSYDMMSQLISATIGSQWTYGYDYYKDGNLREKEYNSGDPCSYSYNGDIMVQAGQQLLDWEYNGNLSSAFGASQTWNWDNRLRSATTGTDQVDYKYDHVGTMIYCKHGSDERIFILDYTNKVPSVLLEIALPNGDVEKEYTWVDGQTIRQTDDMGNSYYYIHDRLGSIRQLIDSGGNIVNSYIYDPFGNILESTVNVENPYLFANYRYESITGMYYCYQRWYHPQLSRFTGYDPVLGKFKEPLTLHAYLYCLNNAINRTDPNGEFSIAGTLGTVGKGLGLASSVYGAADMGWSLGQAITGQISWRNFGMNLMIDASLEIAGVGLFKLGGKLMKLAAKSDIWKAAKKIGKVKNVKSMQKGLRDTNTIDSIKDAMMKGDFDYEKYAIGGYDYKGSVYIGEGNHRMAAALELFKETGDLSYVENIFKHAKWDVPNFKVQGDAFPGRSLIDQIETWLVTH